VFSGFCFGIITGGVVVDRLGYGKLVFAALLFHVISALVIFGASTPENAYNLLFWGSFIFGLANGTLEAVANPLVATIFPNNRTHYLNILHASWPAGMIIGSLIGWVLDDKMEISWKIQLALFLIPTVVYGAMFMGQKFPRSEAAAKGTTFVDMFRSVGILGSLVVCALLALFLGDVFANLGVADAKLYGSLVAGVLLVLSGILTKFSIGSVLLFVLFLTHAVVGSMELGTDGWIQNITGNIFASEEGKWLFIWTSSIMFGLRFCAHFIEKKLRISPIGLLLICALLCVVGLNLASDMTSLAMAFVALGIYAVGKTFLWPTMLAVVGDRFPHTGAVAMSIMGGIGMLSVGTIGGPGLGYLKDRYTAQEIIKTDASVYEANKAAEPSKFLNLEATAIPAVDGGKLGAANKRLHEARKAIHKAGGDQATALATLDESDQKIITASIEGDRRTLGSDAILPMIMAGIYLALLLYFKSIGGYRPLSVGEAEPKSAASSGARKEPAAV
jgi:MFS family permease